MFTPPRTYAAGRLAEERAADTMRDGKHAHLLRMARPVRNGPMRQVVARVGDLLASVRGKLEAGPAPREQRDLTRCPAFECP